MKKLLSLIVICTICYLSTAEAMKRASDSIDNSSLVKRAKQEDSIGWNDLPAEIHQIIFGCLGDETTIIQAPNMAAIFKELFSKRLLSKESSSVIIDRVFLKTIANRYIQVRPEDARNEFLESCVENNIFLFSLFLHAGVDLHFPMMEGGKFEEFLAM